MGLAAIDQAGRCSVCSSIQASTDCKALVLIRIEISAACEPVS